MALVLDSFGFEATAAGHLTLTPNEGRESGKVMTHSAVFELRKTRTVEAAPETAKLFTTSTKMPTGEERIEPRAGVISYDPEMLKTAVPVVAMWKPGAVVTDDRVMLRRIELSKDSHGDDIALLELKGRVLVGFNMDQTKPGLVEVEGAQIPRKLHHALSNTIVGNEGGILVPKDMREEYREFLRIASSGRREVTKLQTNPIRRA
jgi:hypothetical protein